jgi:hypothetical protein
MGRLISAATRRLEAALRAETGGAVKVSYLQDGTGALPRDVQAKLREVVSPAEFNAKLDGVADDYAAMRRAILYCSLNGGGTVRFPDGGGGQARMLAPAFVPENVRIDLNGWTINGGGPGTNWVFETGYKIGSEVLSNIGLPLQSQNVLQMRIVNGTIANAKGIRLQNALDACDFSGLSFVNCTEGISQVACFYASNARMMSRGAAGGTDLPGFKFNNNVNAQTFDCISVVERNVGMEFSGGINAASLRAVNAEQGRVGIVFKDQLSAANIDSSYLEHLEVGIDLTDPTGKENLSIDNCYINTVGVGIWGVQMRSGVRIGRGNHFVNVPVWVRVNDAVSAAYVELLDTEDADNGLPRIPDKYDLGPRINVVGRNLIYSTATGLPVGCNQVTAGIVPLFYGGNSGYSPGHVMFTSVSKAATVAPAFNVYIDTKIVYDPYVFYEFKFVVTDNNGTSKYWGSGSGPDLDMKLTPVGKTVTAVNANGYIRLVLGEHSHPAGTYTCEGVVRIK